jgi:hypothetical protein
MNKGKEPLMRLIPLRQRLALSGAIMRLCGAILLQIWRGKLHSMTIHHQPAYGMVAHTEIEYHILSFEKE